jgi:hypothetical protein
MKTAKLAEVLIVVVLAFCLVFTACPTGNSSGDTGITDTTGTTDSPNTTDTTDTESTENIINAPESVRLEFLDNSYGQGRTDYWYIYLYWSEVSEATSYDTFYGTTSENLTFYKNIIKPDPGQTLRILFDSKVLSPYTVYYFAVRANTAKGKSGFSPVANRKFAPY